MKITFKYDIEKDLWCLLNKGKSSNNSPLPTKVYEQLIASCGENPSDEDTTRFIGEYIAENNINIQERIAIYQNDWDSIADEYQRRAEAIFGTTLPNDITAYLTVNNRCPYDIQNNHFYVSMTAQSPARKTMMHELWHFYTWHGLGADQVKTLGAQKYNDLKEALTVLLNIECKDLLPEGVEDTGYSQHTGLRERIVAFWEKDKNITNLWKYLVENVGAVTFLNEPKLSEHAADADFNERRKNLLPKLKDFVIEHPLFFNKKINVTFLHAGVSSLVCILDTTEEKYILKIPLSKLTSGLEGIFLKVWEGVGVKVPHVFEEGKIGGHFYILMEYFQVATLIDQYSGDELVKNKVYRDLGALLRKMHQVKTEGYSNIVNDKNEPEYSNVATWLANDTRTNEQVVYVKENNLLDSTEHGSIDDVYKIIISRVGSSKETVYCHNDFHTGNIFATEPYTVFDPWPCFHHPYMDITRSIILASKLGMNEVSKQFIEGYFGDEEYDHALLQAFITLNIWVKFPYMHKTNQIETMADLQLYLSEMKHLLK